jgi:hypothetical protein
MRGERAVRDRIICGTTASSARARRPLAIVNVGDEAALIVGY